MLGSCRARHVRKSLDGSTLLERQTKALNEARPPVLSPDVIHHKDRPSPCAGEWVGADFEGRRHMEIIRPPCLRAGWHWIENGARLQILQASKITRNEGCQAR